MDKIFHKNCLPEKLNYLFMASVLTGINFVLTFTMVLQLGVHEIPCPLCLLQRVGFFGAGFGLMSAFRRGYSPAHTGCVLIFMLYLLMVSVRQCMNHIIAGRGDWIGGTLYGLHLSVWSAIIAFCMLLLFSLQLTAVSVTPLIRRKVSAVIFPFINKVGKWMSWYLILLCAFNLLVVILQCGWGICHTYGYALLK